MLLKLKETVYWELLIRSPRLLPSYYLQHWNVNKRRLRTLNIINSHGSTFLPFTIISNEILIIGGYSEAESLRWSYYSHK